MPPEFTLFLDENLHNTKLVLQVLAESAIHVERHKDHFAAGTPDDVWLPVVGRQGWVLLTSDSRMRDRHSERAQVVRAGVRVFYFSSNEQPAVALAGTLRAAIPKIIEILEAHPPPFFASIQKSGRVELRNFTAEI